MANKLEYDFTKIKIDGLEAANTALQQLNQHLTESDERIAALSEELSFVEQLNNSLADGVTTLAELETKITAKGSAKTEEQLHEEIRAVKDFKLNQAIDLFADANEKCRKYAADCAAFLRGYENQICLDNFDQTVELAREFSQHISLLSMEYEELFSRCNWYDVRPVLTAPNGKQVTKLYVAYMPFTQLSATDKAELRYLLRGQ